MEEKKEQDSGRGMVPIPLSKVRIWQPDPETQAQRLAGGASKGEERRWEGGGATPLGGEVALKTIWKNGGQGSARGQSLRPTRFFMLQQECIAFTGAFLT